MKKILLTLHDDLEEFVVSEMKRTREPASTIIRTVLRQVISGPVAQPQPQPQPLAEKRGPGRPPKEKAPPPEPKMWTVDNPPATVDDIISWMLDHMIAAKGRGEIVSLYRIPERDKELYLLLMARNKNYRHTTPAGLTDGMYAFMASGKVKDTGEKEGDAPILEIVGEPTQVNPVPDETFTPYLIAPPAKPAPVAPVIKNGW